VEVLQTLLLLGAGQGLFLTLVLATKKSNHTANRILAVAMFAFSIFLYQGVYYERGTYQAFPHLIGISVPLVCLFGPIIYLYAEAVSEGHERFRWKGLLHLIPYFLVTLYYLPFYFSSGAEKLAFLERLMREGEPADLRFLGHFQLPYGIFYAVLTILLLRRHRARVKESYSTIEPIDLIWLRNLTVGATAVWSVAALDYLFKLAGIAIPGANAAVPVTLALMVYAVGYLGLRQREIVVPAVATRHPTPAPLLAADDASSYEKSGLTPEEAEGVMKRLRQTIEEGKLYLRSDLTLQELAENAGISPHNVSEAINTRAGKNFYDFVNSYRAEEAMRRLRDPKHANLTILAIATDSGFNSKSVFNAYFKEHTGQTPSQYRNVPTS
jgi:AraC-like DNA-binding protein